MIDVLITDQPTSQPIAQTSNKANLRNLIAATGLVISNWIQIVDFQPTGLTLNIDGWPWKTKGHFFYTMSSFVHHVKSIGEFKRVTVRKRSIEIGNILSRVTWKFDGWPWKIVGHLFYTTSSFVHYFKSIGEVKLELQSGNARFRSKLVICFVPHDLEIWWMTLKNNRTPHLYHILCVITKPWVNQNRSYSRETLNSGQNRHFVVPCDLEIWRMTLKNNREPLLRYITLCASFHCHMWIKTGITVRKRLNVVMTSVTLTFAPWSWPFVWTSRLSMVITPENFRVIWWQEHCQKVWRTDGRTYGQKSP